MEERDGKEPSHLQVAVAPAVSSMGPPLAEPLSIGALVALLVSDLGVKRPAPEFDFRKGSEGVVLRFSARKQAVQDRSHD